MQNYNEQIHSIGIVISHRPIHEHLELTSYTYYNNFISSLEICIVQLI